MNYEFYSSNDLMHHFSSASNNFIQKFHDYLPKIEQFQVYGWFAFKLVYCHSLDEKIEQQQKIAVHEAPYCLLSKYCLKSIAVYKGIKSICVFKFSFGKRLQVKIVWIDMDIGELLSYKVNSISSLFLYKIDASTHFIRSIRLNCANLAGPNDKTSVRWRSTGIWWNWWGWSIEPTTEQNSKNNSA